MSLILTSEIANDAIRLALPSIRRIIAKHNWGPKGVVIMVAGNGLKRRVTHVMRRELGPRKLWKKRYEKCDFITIAGQKLRDSLRTGLPSSAVIRTPWRLRHGDSVYGGAVAEDTDLAVSVSGLYEDWDEVCGWIIWNIVTQICKDSFVTIKPKVQHL